MTREHVRTLVVDHGSGLGTEVAAALTDTGCSFERHAVGATELATALAGRTWDIVVCAHLPGSLDALNALETARAAAPELPFLIVSDAIEDDAAARAMRAGASDVIARGAPRRLAVATERALAAARAGRRHQLVEHALEESEERFRTIASNIPGMVYQMTRTHDGNLRFPYVSDGAYALLGVRAGVLRERPSCFLELIAAEDLPSFHSGMLASANALTAWNWEGRVLIGAERETKWVNLRASPRSIGPGAVQWEGIMWNITNSKLAERENLDSQRQLQALSSHLETVKERERANIAREIHDEIGGTLTAIKIDLLWLAQRLPEERPELANKMNVLETLVDQAMETSTRIARDLRPSILDFGIAAAIEWQAKEFRKRMGIDCRMSCAEGDIELSPDVSMALFRIFQETLTNISKHARASRVDVTLGTRGGWVELQVADNGQGLGRHDLAKPKSFGIRGMLERARYLGGEIDLRGAPGAGTTVTVRVPLDAGEPESASAEEQQALF
jgi:two-component system, NarL family, sensor histidine kinase UhpB